MYSSKQAVKYFSQGVFFLALTTLAPGIHAEEGFSYSEDWALVSAPPPPGPYRPVHLDPRVPGQGAVSSIMMDIPSEKGFLFASAVLAVGLVMLVGLLGASVILWSAGVGPELGN